MVSFKLAYILLVASINHTNAKDTIRGNGSYHSSQVDADAKMGLDTVENMEYWARMLQVGSLPNTERPTNRPTPRPTRKPSRRPTPRPETSLPTLSPTIIPELSPEPSIGTPEPTPAPSLITPEPITPAPSPQPSIATAEPTPAPSLITPEPITPAPSPQPSIVTAEPTPAPSLITPEPITPVPSPQPSIATAEPSGAPSAPPTLITSEPSPQPSSQPSTQPSFVTAEPTPTPSSITPITPDPTPSPTLITPTPPPSFPCNLTPEERATQLRQLYSAFSEDALFDDPSTPQAQALNWITNEDTLAICPNDNSCQPLQRYILATFYFATNGGSWINCNAPSNFDDPASIQEANNNCNRVVTPFAVPNQRVGESSTDAWLTPVNECEWGGIACWGPDTPNLNLCIDQLDFENNGITGTLVDELGALDMMRFIILEQGGIKGNIPTTFALLNRLLILDMDFNLLEGQLPDELYGLSSLQQLDLNDNLLTGTIPTLIGQMKLLTFLQMDHNEISGPIPTEMGELDQLRIAFLGDTALTGVMPDEVCANRNNTNPPGNLGVLVTDCSGNPPQLECSCCSSCT